MKTVKQVLRPDRVRSTPEQFSWIDHGLVQHHLIDRCSSRSAALYLFLVTVADCEGLSYYGASTLASRLHLSETELATARTELIALDLIAWRAPLYQVLALPTKRAPALTASSLSPTAPVVCVQQAARPASLRPLPTRSAQPPTSTRPTTPTPNVRLHSGLLSLAQLIDLERRHAQL